MSPRGTIRLKAIFKMLDDCAKGHKKVLGDHYWRITYKKRVYPTLPRGTRSSDNPEIQIQHVNKLIRALKINRDCAKDHLPALN